ncbi:MAG: hypothetical protein C4288_03725 [Leptolyngbya sp. ERB_1_1]
MAHFVCLAANSIRHGASNHFLFRTQVILVKSVWDSRNLFGIQEICLGFKKFGWKSGNLFGIQEICLGFKKSSQEKE